MLTQPSFKPRHQAQQQEGIVLIIALIMLVAMTLGGLALVRSVYTGTNIAGNLAFQQAATNSSDSGIEAAVTWLESNNGTGALNSNIDANGYSASKTRAEDASSNQSWDNLWTNVWVPRGVVTVPVGTNSSTVDSGGNTVQYAIQRLCNATGEPFGLGNDCAVSPIATASTSNSHGAGAPTLSVSSQVYYRITVRVSGPRNTVSYVQTTVAL
jgi:Tfp pilus assembly protein PilX